MIYYINGHEARYDEHRFYVDNYCEPSGSYNLKPTYLQFSSGIPYSDLTILNFDSSVEVIRPAWIVCDHCGIRNPDNDKTFYCNACGAPLPEDQFLVRRYNG